MQNIGIRFENWAANRNNYQKLSNGEKVEPFRFTDTDMTTVPQAQKDDYYKSQVLDISKSRIFNYDANHNGKMEFNEYAEEQKTVYFKTFGEKLDFTIKGMYEMLQKNFDNADVNGDGSIDEKEMSAVFAYMDSAKDGKFNGKIDFGTAVATDWSDSSLKVAFKKIQNFIFGE